MSAPDTMETVPEPPAPTRPPRWRRAALAAAVLTAAGVAGVLWFFSGDAPDEADLAETAAAVDAQGESAEPGEGDSTSAPAPAPDGIEGTWSVDTGVGEFSATESTAATFAGFRIEEELAGIGSTTAVGRTPVVAGTVTIDGATLTSAEIAVDLTAIVSNESRRDSRIQQALDTSANPAATFVLVEPADIGAGAADGETVEVTAVGDLTLNGVTNRVSIPLEAQLVDGSILVVGSTDIVFADYDVSVPSAPVVLSVEEHGILEVQVWFSR